MRNSLRDESWFDYIFVKIVDRVERELSLNITS